MNPVIGTFLFVMLGALTIASFAYLAVGITSTKKATRCACGAFKLPRAPLCFGCTTR